MNDSTRFTHISNMGDANLIWYLRTKRPGHGYVFRLSVSFSSLCLSRGGVSVNCLFCDSLLVPPSPLPPRQPKQYRYCYYSPDRIRLTSFLLAVWQGRQRVLPSIWSLYLLSGQKPIHAEKKLAGLDARLLVWVEMLCKIDGELTPWFMTEQYGGVFYRSGVR